MQRIIELHEQAGKILHTAQNCLDEIGHIQRTEKDLFRQQELKAVHIRAYKMTMRSYMRCINRIKEIYDGTEW